MTACDSRPSGHDSLEVLLKLCSRHLFCVVEVRVVKHLSRGELGYTRYRKEGEEGQKGEEGKGVRRNREGREDNEEGKGKRGEEGW